jgi:hypothetical protein
MCVCDVVVFLPSRPLADIRELISVDDVMEHMHLGPNGALIYCMECVICVVLSTIPSCV